MSFPSIIWDPDDDPNGNVQHIAEHDLSIDDVEWGTRFANERGVQPIQRIASRLGLHLFWRLHLRRL